MIPIENSLAGSVLEHFDLLLTHDVRVEQETMVRIRHNLIALPGVTIEEIERVSSHPVALAQCRRFLAAHPAMKALAAYDTAGSVKQTGGVGRPARGGHRQRGGGSAITAPRFCKPASRTTRKTLRASFWCGARRRR